MRDRRFTPHEVIDWIKDQHDAEPDQAKAVLRVDPGQDEARDPQYFDGYQYFQWQAWAWIIGREARAQAFEAREEFSRPHHSGQHGTEIEGSDQKEGQRCVWLILDIVPVIDSNVELLKDPPEDAGDQEEHGVAPTHALQKRGTAPGDHQSVDRKDIAEPERKETKAVEWVDTQPGGGPGAATESKRKKTVSRETFLKH